MKAFLMKNFLLLFLALNISIAVSAQKILDQTVTFTSIRLPLKPLDTSIKGYSFEVETPYPANSDAIVSNAKKQHDQDVKSYPEKVKKSEEDYQVALKQYDKDVETARENFKLESDEFNKKSALERLALSEDKPALHLPTKPNYYKPGEPEYVEPALGSVIIANPEFLAASLKLEGYKKSNDTATTLYGDAIVGNFDYVEPERKSDVQSQYNVKTGQSEKRTVVSYITRYKQPVFLKLKYNGKMIFDGIIDSTSVYTSLKESNPSPKINIERKSLDEAIQKTNEFINSNYGFTPISHEYKVRYVKNNKGEYDALEQAKNKAVKGYLELSNSSNSENLNQAIKEWNEILEQSDPSDRKAHVDEKVTTAILFNLVDAYMVSNEAEKAFNTYNKLIALKLNYSDELEAKKYPDQISDLKNRVEANK